MTAVPISVGSIATDWNCGVDGSIVTNPAGGVTVYYGDEQYVTSASNNGNIASGASATLFGTTFFAADSRVTLEIEAIPSVGGSGGGGGGLSTKSSGPGGAPAAVTGAAVTVGDTSSFSFWWGVLNAATVTVTLPAPVIGARFTGRFDQDATGGRALAFAGSPSVQFPALALSILTAPNAENWIEFFSDGVIWLAFPVTTAATNLSDIADPDTARANLKTPILAGVQAVATTNIASLSGTTTVDTVALVAGDRVLLSGQTTTSQNGVWVVAAGAWSRPNDLAVGAVVKSRLVLVIGGTTNPGTLWRITSASGITVGTTGFTPVKLV